MLFLRKAETPRQLNAAAPLADVLAPSSPWLKPFLVRVDKDGPVSGGMAALPARPLAWNRDATGCGMRDVRSPLAWRRGHVAQQGASRPDGVHQSGFTVRGTEWTRRRLQVEATCEVCPQRQPGQKSDQVLKGIYLAAAPHPGIWLSFFLFIRFGTKSFSLFLQTVLVPGLRPFFHSFYSQFPFLLTNYPCLRRSPLSSIVSLLSVFHTQRDKSIHSDTLQSFA